MTFLSWFTYILTHISGHSVFDIIFHILLHPYYARPRLDIEKFQAKYSLPSKAFGSCNACILEVIGKMNSVRRITKLKADTPQVAVENIELIHILIQVVSGKNGTAHVVPRDTVLKAKTVSSSVLNIWQPGRIQILTTYPRPRTHIRDHQSAYPKSEIQRKKQSACHSDVPLAQRDGRANETPSGQ